MDRSVYRVSVEGEQVEHKGPVNFEVREGADLGAAIGELRRDLGLTQKAAARSAGINVAYLSKIEQGRTVSLLEHQLRILRRLGARITIEWEPPSKD